MAPADEKVWRQYPLDNMLSKTHLHSEFPFRQLGIRSTRLRALELLRVQTLYCQPQKLSFLKGLGKV